MRRPFFSLLVLGLVAATLALSSSSSPASAAEGDVIFGIEIERTSPSPRPSGTPFIYDIDLSCDFLGGTGDTASCDDVVITIPLGDLAGLPAPGVALALSDSDLIESWERVGDDLVIRMIDSVPPGESARIQLTVTPPNLVTPNGTSWSLLPVATGSNIDETPAPLPADGQATATLGHTISKRVQGSAFRDPGDTVVYDITVACSITQSGKITAETMTITDTVPAGLTFVSATPAATQTGDTLSWDLSGGDLPASCTSNSGGSVPFQVTATVDDDVEYGTGIENTATVSSTTIDGQTIAPVSGKASITIIGEDTNLPGTFDKSSFGQLRDRDAAPSSSAASVEANSHTTYPGNWAGYRNPQPNNVLNNYTPNQNTDMLQSGYKMQYSSTVDQGAGFQLKVVDPVPCLDNKTNQVYSSNAPGNLCQNPAFHVTTAAVWSSTAGGVPALPNTYVPLVRYADGSTAPMVRTNGGVAGGANNAQFVIPDLARTDIAEIEFPRHVGLSGPTVRFGVFGYVDGAVERGEIAKDISEFETFWREGTVVRQTGRDDADLYIEDFPQVGIEKRLAAHNSAGPNRSTLRLDARLFVSGAAAEDFTVTDLLPAGMTVVEPLADPTVTYTRAGPTGTPLSGGLPVATEVINNYKGTGRQLVRYTVAQADLAPLASARINLSSAVTVSYVNEPGTYNNTAQAFYSVDSLVTSCQQNPAYPQEASDPYDLNGNGIIADPHCASRASLTVPPPSGGAAYKVAKTVQGKDDDAPKAYPGIGLVGEDGGPVTFGLSWKNTGGSPLKDAVIYDIFPAVGDRGVGGTVAGLPRYSQFDAEFVGIGPVPAGVTVAYSTSDNPCRPQVFANADNPGCVDDWTTTQPTDKSTITAIRLTSSQTYQPGQGFEFTVEMTTGPVEAGQLAWNSIAGHAAPLTGRPLRPTSPPKVGITATEEGIPLLIGKELDPAIDPAVVNVGDTVSYLLTVSNPAGSTRTFNGYDVLPSGLSFVDVTPVGSTPMAGVGLEPGSDPERVLFENIDVASGATLTWKVSATVDLGAVGEQINRFGGENSVPVTPPCEDDPDETCVTVVVPPGKITVTKAVTGDGAAFAPDSFTGQVRCLVGQTPFITRTFTFSETSTYTLDDLPQGAECLVEETTDGGATNVSFSPSDTVTIPAGEDSAVSVTITNRFDAGSLVVRKEVTGVGAALSGGTFTFGVQCTFGDAQVLDTSIDVSVPGGSTVATSDPIGPLPIGAQCTVTETAAAGDVGPDTTPAPVTVEIVANDDDNTVSATLVNPYSAGTISVTKALEGEWADTGAENDTVFTVQVSCLIGDETIWSGPLNVKGGETVAAVDGNDDPVLLPLGTLCFAEETDDGGATDVDVSADSIGNGVEVVAGDPATLQPLEIDVTNTFDAGSLTVVKTVSGVGAPLNTGIFAFDVACTFAGDNVYDERVLVGVADGGTEGRSAVIAPLPVGASCEVTEVDAGGADEVPDPVNVTIGEGDEPGPAAEVAEFDNSYSAGTITVVKELDGAWAGTGAEDDTVFQIAVECTIGDDVIWEGDIDIKAGTSVTVSEGGQPVLLPVGTRCIGEEVDTAGATSATVTPSSTQDAVVVEAGQPDELQALTLTVVNTFDAGLLRVTKTLTGVGTPVAAGPIVFDVACTFQDRTVLERELSLDVAPGQTVLTSTVGPLPIGAQCTVTETDAGNADATPDPVTVEIAINSDDNTVTASFVNRFSAGTISVTKALDGAWAATGAENETVFTVQVSCLIGDETVWSGALSLKGGETVTAVGEDDAEVLLPLGTVCFAEETADGGATDVDISADSVENGVEVVAGDPDTLQALEIDVTNTFDAGSLAVAKTVSGVGAALNTGSFTFDVQCTFGDRTIYDGDITIDLADDETGGRSDVIAPLPVGASCEVTETDAGGADEVPEPVTVVIGDTESGTEQVEFENSYSAGVLTVAKELDGLYAGDPLVTSRTFDLTVMCGPADDSSTGSVFETTVTLAGGQVETITDDDGDPLLIPAGTGCYVTEVDGNGASATTSANGVAANAILVAKGMPDKLQAVDLVVTNTFDTDPNVSGGGTDGPPSGGNGYVTGTGYGTGGTGGGILPRTGAEIAAWVTAGLGLLTAGAVLVLSTTRRRTRSV